MKKIKDYARKDISPCAWHWVSTNIKLMSQDQFKEWCGVSFYEFTKTHDKECMAAWGFYLADCREIAKEQKAKAKNQKEKECNCAQGMAVKNQEAIWNCKMHGNTWNGIRNKK